MTKKYILGFYSTKVGTLWSVICFYCNWQISAKKIKITVVGGNGILLLADGLDAMMLFLFSISPNWTMFEHTEWVFVILLNITLSFLTPQTLRRVHRTGPCRTALSVSLYTHHERWDQVIVLEVTSKSRVSALSYRVKTDKSQVKIGTSKSSCKSSTFSFKF